MQAAKPLIIITTPWRKYSNYFDKNCWGIWGLAPILKFSLLAFFLVFIPPLIGLASFDDGYSNIVLAVFLFFVLIWTLYLPFFFTILLKRGILQTIILSKRSIHYLTSKPNYFKSKNPETLELIIRALRYYFWIYSTKLIYKHRKTLAELTTIYPISLLFQNRMWHARNRHIINTIRKIESIASKGKVPILIDEINLGEYFEFIAHFTKSKRWPTKTLEKLLQKNYDTIYVRKYRKGQIQISTTIGENGNN